MTVPQSARPFRAAVPIGGIRPGGRLLPGPARPAGPEPAGSPPEPPATVRGLGPDRGPIRGKATRP